MQRSLLHLAFVGLLLAASVQLASSEESSVGLTNVKVLTDENFEHDTQAVTGATTGDWFVEFYAPWCGHCKRLEETWEKLGTQMKEEREAGEAYTIIAKVDGTKQKYLAGRFGIRGFPTLLMFSKGKMYKFEGERSLDKLLAFARGGFKEVTSVPVPKGTREMDLVDRVRHIMFDTLQKDMEQIWKFHKAAFFVSAGGFFVLGLLLGRFLLAPSAPKASSEKKTQ